MLYVYNENQEIAKLIIKKVRKIQLLLRYKAVGIKWAIEFFLLEMISLQNAETFQSRS